MNIYNTVHGVNLAAIFVLPMLGRTPDAYPRFRDCFVEERQFTYQQGPYPEMTPIDGGQKDVICILTRTGGANRDEYGPSIAEMRAMPGYLTDYDDPFNSTYASFVYAVPLRWRKDYDTIMERRFTSPLLWDALSADYKQEIRRIYPQCQTLLANYFQEAHHARTTNH